MSIIICSFSFFVDWISAVLLLLLLQRLCWSPFLKHLSDATHPSSLLQKCVLPHPLWKGETSKDALRRSFGEVNPQEVWDQSCTSVVVLACFLATIPAHLWTQMEIHLLPVPSWLVFLPFYSHLPPSLSRASLPAEARTSPCAYQTVYPFPVGAVFHLWLWQPIATSRVHSKPWFRHPASPALLYHSPLPPISCEFFTHKELCHYILPFPHARMVETDTIISCFPTLHFFTPLHI